MFDRNKAREQELLQKIETLEQEKKFAVEEVKLLKVIQQPQQVIGNIITVPQNDHSFLMIVDKNFMQILPNGHKAYGISRMRFIVDSGGMSSLSALAQVITYSKYFSTEGAIAYIAGTLLFKRAYDDGSISTESKHGTAWVKNETPRELVGSLLMEEVLGKETRIYPALQQLIRQENRAVLKVTFPEPMTRDQAREVLGIPQRQVDPEVEVIFE